MSANSLKILNLRTHNPAITGVMRTFTGVSLFSAAMTPFTTGVPGSVTGVVRPGLVRCF